MPPYFFEIDDGTLRTAGDSIDLVGPQEVRRAVLASLPDMARDMMPNGDDCTIKVIATDETGRVVYRATLTIRGQWDESF